MESVVDAAQRRVVDAAQRRVVDAAQWRVVIAAQRREIGVAVLIVVGVAVLIVVAAAAMTVVAVAVGHAGGGQASATGDGAAQEATHLLRMLPQLRPLLWRLQLQHWRHKRMQAHRQHADRPPCMLPVAAMGLLLLVEVVVVWEPA